MNLTELLLAVTYTYLLIATLGMHLELARRIYRHIRFRRYLAAKAR